MKDIQLLSLVLIVAAPLLVSTGCYTQLGTVEDPYDDRGIVQEEYIEDEPLEEFDREYPSSNSYVTFTYYHPGVTIGYGWYDPWYYNPYPYYTGWCSPWPVYGWVWYPSPAYACWPYVPYYPPSYGGPYYGGGSHYGGGGYASDTRDFGNTRGSNDGIRGTRDGSGRRSAPAGEVADRTTTVSRTQPPSRSGGTVASSPSDTPKRRTVQGRIPPRRGTVATPAPAKRNDSGATRGGSQRQTVSKPPASTPPAAPAPAGRTQSRGGDNQRGGGRR